MCRNERTKIKEEWVSVTHGVWDRSSVISCLHISVLCGPAHLHQFQATLFPTCSQSLHSCSGSFPTSPSMGIAWRTSSKIAGLHPQSLWFSRSGWGWEFALLRNSQVMLSLLVPGLHSENQLSATEPEHRKCLWWVWLKFLKSDICKSASNPLVT